jgi:hypothetical protein
VKVIQRSIEIDQRHGLSDRFKSWFLTLIGQGKALDEKTRASQRAAELASQVDAKTGAQEKAKQAYSVGRGKKRNATLGIIQMLIVYCSSIDYYLNALSSPFGQKVEQFYSDVSKQVQDVHGPCFSKILPCCIFAHLSLTLTEEARRIADAKKGPGASDQGAASSTPAQPSAASTTA